MKHYFILLAFILLASTNCRAPQQTQKLTSLLYDQQNRGAVPIPPSERSLQTVSAQHWFKVSDQNHILEGAIFDQDGNLFFCDVTARRVLRLTPDRKLSTIITLDSLSPGGLAFDKNGRLYIAALNLEKKSGAIYMVPSGKPDILPLKTTLSLSTAPSQEHNMIQENNKLNLIMHR